MIKIKLLWSIGIVVSLTFVFTSQAKSQERTDEESAFVNSSLIEILTKMTENSSKAANEIKLSLEQEKENRRDLEGIKNGLASAQRELRFRQLAESAARIKLNDIYHSQGGAQSINENKITQGADRLQAAINRRVEVETRISDLLTIEKVRTEEIEKQQNHRKAVQEKAAADEPKRAQRKNNLETLAKQWRLNQTDENFTSLTEEITNVAAEEGADGAVLWKSTPRQGVLVRYQTKRARERNDVPLTSLNPTDTMKGEPVTIGRYYVWSEEKGRAISDRNRLVYITASTKEVTVVIDR